MRRQSGFISWNCYLVEARSARLETTRDVSDVTGVFREDAVWVSESRLVLQIGYFWNVGDLGDSEK